MVHLAEYHHSWAHGGDGYFQLRLQAYMYIYDTHTHTHIYLNDTGSLNFTGISPKNRDENLKWEEKIT